MAMFEVVFEVSFVFDPVFSNKFEMVEIVLSIKNGYSFVVEDSVALKLILKPLALIGYFAVFIVEDSSALHFVFDPFSTVLSSLLILKSAKSMAIPTDLVPLVPAVSHLLSHVLRNILIALRILSNFVFFKGKVLRGLKYIESVMTIELNVFSYGYV